MTFKFVLLLHRTAPRLLLLLLLIIAC